MRDFIQDVIYGLRTLRKAPAFALASIVTLMLCVGANTAIFTIVNAVLLRPLPYPDAHRLVWISEYVPQMGANFGLGPDYLLWHDSARSFEHLAAYDTEDFNASGAGDPLRVAAAEVTSPFFPLFNAQPAMGRGFSAAEDRPGADPVTVLSYGFWQSHFGGRANVIGNRISLNGTPHTIVGVMPQDFRFPDNSLKPDLLLPLALLPFSGAEGSFRNVSMMGKLAPGVSLAQGAAELDGLNLQNHAPYSGETFFQGMQVRVETLQEHLVGDTRLALLVLMATVTLVLLIGCVNVANLQLARSAARKKEIAVRSALGAGRARLIRQLLTESLLLASVGVVCGLLLAAWAIRALRTLNLEFLPQLNAVTLDRNVYLFAALLVVTTTVLFGLLPGLTATSDRSIAPLNAAGGRATPALAHRRLSNALVISELALALILLAGAGLLIRTFVSLVQIDPGFRSEGLLTAKITLPEGKYTNNQQRQAFFENLLQRLQGLPGVTSAAVGSSLPLAGHGIRGRFRAEGQPEGRIDDAPKAFFDTVSADYFRTLGMNVVEGRTFSAADSTPATPNVILNQAAAAQFFPGQHAVGKHIKMAAAQDWAEIVGVVGSVKDNGLDEDASPQIYVPLGHSPTPSRIAIRTVGNPAQYAALLRREVQAIDSSQPVFDVTTMNVQVATSLEMRRFNMVLLTAFATLALTLAAVGIYGLISYNVTQRTQEIGIRLALGADRYQVLKLMVGTGVRLTVAGLILGTAGFLALSRFMSSLLWGVHAADALTVVCGGAALAIVAVAATYIPSRRATRVDPLVALRYE